MTDVKTTLEPIKFRKKFTYEKKVPTLVSNSVSCYDEISRWILDFNEILYKDEPHAPGLYIPITNRLTGNKGGLWNVPVLVNTDALIYQVEGLVQFVNARQNANKSLIPIEHKDRVIELFNKFHHELTNPVSKYVYSLLLPNRKYAVKLFCKNIPRLEKLIVKIAYPILRKALAGGLELTENTNENRIKSFKETFSFVEGLLADGRKYLVGDQLTIADICFSSIAAPILLPDQFGASITSINEIPEELRKTVIEMRARPAGQFVLRIYREHRGEIRNSDELPVEESAISRFKSRISGAIFGSKFKTNLFSFLQSKFPVIKIWFTNLVIINSHELVVEVLNRNEDFTIEEINAKKMAALNDSFFLGMDRMNPQFDLERNFVRKASRREDMAIIRDFVVSESKLAISLAQQFGKIDVANSLTRVVMTRLVTHYFGVHAAEDVRMKEWLRAIFWDLFLNLGDDEAIHSKAKNAADDMKLAISGIITSRKAELKSKGTLDDNLLNRFILMQQEEGNDWFDDDAIRRNISGIITGSLETTNKCVILVLDELFRRPKVLKEAIKVAQDNDVKLLYGYVSEALRFNPHQPLVMRYTESKQTIKGKKKTYTIPAKKKIFAVTAAAMLDPEFFPNPKQFDPKRESIYMNYGFALHECYGKYINQVTITELVAAVLKLPNLRRASGAVGRSTGLMEGPFPNNFVVDFD